MSHMFCTLKEAAKTLHASEDQIQALLERGLLHEFREGPHRLLREADVGALDLKRRRRSQEQRSAQPQTRTQRPSPPSENKPKTSRAAETKPPPSATAVSRAPQPRRTEDRGRKAQDGARRTEAGRAGVSAHRGSSRESARSAQPPSPARASPSILDTRPSECLSVRQWFWMGLVQDRPAAVALLSGLVLLGLAALAAGLCFLTEVF